MKVLHVVSGDLWAGAEAQALLLITGLAAESGLQLHVVVLNEGELARRLTASGVAVTVLQESVHSAPALLIRLWLLQRRLQPQVVHTHRLKENILGSLSALVAGVPVCLRTAHGMDEHPPRGWRNWPQRLLRSFDAWCANYLQQAVIAVSEELGEQLRRQLPGCRVEVVPNGVDPDALRASVRWGQTPQWDRRRCHVGIVGRLVPVKRVDLFLQAAALLNARHPQRWHFHVLGEGPLALPLQDQAARLQLLDNVSFAGQISPAAPWLAALDLLVMPSDHEGMPMVALEACALGVPMVAHDVGGLRELLPAERLVHRQAPDAYADAIESAADQLRHTVKASAAPLPDRFTARQNAATIRALYTALLARD